MIYNFEKEAKLGSPLTTTQILYHAHLHVILIMCCKFHLDDLKTVGEV